MEKGIKKDEVIKHSLLLLGFPFSDVDSKEAEIYKSASFLFDTAVAKLLKDYTFPFSIERERINHTDRFKYLGKYEYVKPANFLSSLTPGIEERGDRLYSMERDIELTYKKYVDASDIPLAYSRFLSILLAIELAPSGGKVKALNRLYTLYQEELSSVVKIGSFDIRLEDLN